MYKLESSFFLNEKLEVEHLNYFNKNGFIVFRNFLSPEYVDVLISELVKVEHQLIRDEKHKINGIPLKYGENLAGEKTIQRICFSSLFSDVFKKLLSDPRLDLLKEFLGVYDGRINEHEKDGLVINNYIRTLGSTFSKMGWHTDSPRDLFLGQKIMPMLNIGIHLDECLFKNGGLRLLPGTHKQGMFKLLFGKKYFLDNSDDSKQVGFDIFKGDLTIHSGKIWHRVKESSLYGEESRRRVMYIPMITGKKAPKNENSKTPLYHKITSKIKI
jgi:phytanoyl-CoA hydroxylase